MSSSNQDSRNLSAGSHYPGLEVIPDNVPKIAIPSQAAGLQAVHDNPGLETAVQPASERIDDKANDTKEQTTWWKRKRILIAVVLLAFAVVVGGVLGTRWREDSDGPPSQNATTTVSISSLSVTSFSMDEFTSMLLAYVDQEGIVKYHVRSGSDNQTRHSWSTPQTLGNENKISKGSGIAVSTQVDLLDTEIKIAYSFSYIDEGSVVNLWSLDFQDNTSGFTAQKPTRPLKVLSNAKLNAYGPWIAYEDAAGAYGITRARPRSNETLGVFRVIRSGATSKSLKNGGKQIITPLMTNVTESKSPSYLASVYQADDGTLNSNIYYQLFLENFSGKVEDFDRSGTWPTDFPNITLPQGHLFSAFAAARAVDDTRVNVYILYQDEDRNIRQVWTDDGETWQYASPEAMRNADNGTDIACLTMSTVGPNWIYPVWLIPDTPLRRCFFQRGGSLVEVGMFGSEWEEIQTIPL